MAEPDPADYWLKRFATALEKAVDAPGEPSRNAYMELARHYWSMHSMVHGKSPSSAPIAEQGLIRSGELALKWAA